MAMNLMKDFSTAWFGTFILIFLFSNSFAVEVSYDNRAIKIDGKRRILISGSIHYPRSTPEMWPSLIKKAKDGGLNAIDTYVFWNIHEPLYRQYDFSGNRNFIKFFKTIHQEGLYALLRVGPYVSAEWNFGGFPAWLLNMPNITFRTINDAFMDEMKTFTKLIINMVKQEKLLATQGGPIILAQIENEYGDINSAYGKNAKQYIDWCANYAQSLNIGVPWIMCQESDAPTSMITACNGWYCDQFTPKNPNIPKIWAENWTGWYKGWGGRNPHRTAEDTAFAVARFYQNGGTVQNYYMYHGGTNFGRIAGGPYIATSYQCDGMLDEFGNYNQPKWGHLKQLHLLLRSMEEVLTYGETSNFEYGDKLTVTKYVYNGTRICFFGNANETHDITITFEGYNYTVPAWSVSIFQDCHTELYNTAKVNTPTSVMVKKPNLQDDSEGFTWRWKLEPFQKLKSPWKGFSSSRLLDQKVVTNDTSDYLWYMTSVDIEEDDPIWGDEVTLHVNSSGHILHAFLNGVHMGTHLAHNGKFKFIFEQNVKLNIGKNTIVLLSVTAGLQNYGAFFDKVPTGILGPVKLIAPNSRERDLSTNLWAYKIGLKGLQKGSYNRDPDYYQEWHSEDLPVNKMFVWYQTTFQTPVGEDPIVLDLLGMGKGISWVNGHNIGRYWPSYITYKDGCNGTYCDYRGQYHDTKCMTNCGGSTQRWYFIGKYNVLSRYHVPRSFLNEKENILVLFEEVGGDPSSVSVQTVTIGKTCGNVYEGNTLELSCQGGRVISDIRFASFGDPKGGCRFFESFEKGMCDSPNSFSVVTKACVGKERCAIDVSEKMFEFKDCRNIPRSLAVEAVC